MKTNQHIIALAVISVIVAVTYYFMFVRMTKDKAIKILSSRESGIVDAEKLKTFGDDYVIAWGKAELKGKLTFELDGKAYSTATGKRV